MSSTGDSKKSICGCGFFKPFTAENLVHHYLPLQSMVSYSALAVNIMNPALVVRVFPKQDVTNLLLFNTMAGSGLYLYNRPHIAKLPASQKIVYSVFCSTAFSLGSVLMWAIVRSVVPQSTLLRTLCGVGSSLALMKIGCNYVAHLDSLKG